MIIPILLLVLTVQQIAYSETSDYCHTHRKVNAADLVRTINQSPKTTWKASTYGLKEMDLNYMAKTKLGVKMDGLQTLSAAEIKKLKKEARKSRPDNSELPDNFTWVKTNRTTCPIGTVRDQSNCGSCWAVATASVLSDRYCIKAGANFTTPLSHQYLLGCTKNCDCGGGYMYMVFDKLKTNGTITGGEYDSDQGCQTYSIRPCGEFHYAMPCDRKTAFTPSCRQKKCNNDWYKLKEEQETYKISSYSWMSAYYSSDYYVRQEIYNTGPIVAVFWVYPDFMLYKSGIYVHKSGWWPLGGHAVKVVGWGVENNTKYWHVANSWGKNWGEDGFFRIRRGTNECSFEYNLATMTPILNNSTTTNK